MVLSRTLTASAQDGQAEMAALAYVQLGKWMEVVYMRLGFRLQEDGSIGLDNEDHNSDLCVLCGLGGNLLCCDGCPAAFHIRCIGESAKSLPEGEWLCPECLQGNRGEFAKAEPWLLNCGFQWGKRGSCAAQCLSYG